MNLEKGLFSVRAIRSQFCLPLMTILKLQYNKLTPKLQVDPTQEVSAFQSPMWKVYLIIFYARFQI